MKQLGWTTVALISGGIFLAAKVFGNPSSPKTPPYPDFPTFPIFPYLQQQYQPLPGIKKCTGRWIRYQGRMLCVGQQINNCNNECTNPMCNCTGGSCSCSKGKPIPCPAGPCPPFCNC